MINVKIANRIFQLAKLMQKTLHEFKMTLPRKQRPNIDMALRKMIKQQPLKKREKAALDQYVAFLVNKIELGELNE